MMGFDNANALSGDGWRSITDIFDDRARAHPDMLAVEAQDERRSYDELAERVDLFARRLAHRLAGDDTGGNGARDRLIGVCLARDVDLPAWLLAVLKVGGAYLPIDPELPAARLAVMLEDARPALIVASRRYAPSLAGIETPVMVAEDDAPAPVAPTFPIAPDTLAYVIFTSGSTGRPKGVEIEHGSLVALMTTMAVAPGFGAGQRMLGLTRISFDLSVPDMFLPFFAGGSLALVDMETAADPAKLAAAFDTYRPDLAQGTPSTWRSLLESGWRGQPDLRVLAGGETVTRALADRLLPCCGELWNIYGPTETTVWSTTCRVRPGVGPVPIGWPMEGVCVHVADAEGRSVPAGTVGEIVIGGVGVARGYRNRPDLTADRFVAQPDGSRGYRTGDLGRFEDGALYCLGRLDDQVKIRGFRIELGDVEAAMAAHPAVAWCAVRLWTDPAGEAVMVGYLVPRIGPVPSARAVKAFLATQIASYMVPDRILTVAAMPLTPNGKVDRAALPDPFAVIAPPPARGPDCSVQGRLAAIWIDLLSLQDVGPQDDFFELGGYSLMTVRLTRRIEQEFGVKLALVELMNFSTLAAMATRIDAGQDAPGSTTMLLNAPGDRPPLFWIDAGPLMRTMTRHLSPDQPAFALNTDASDEDALGSDPLSISAVATRLKARLIAAQPTGPYYLGGWCRWGIVAFDLARQLVEDGERVGLLVLLDADRPGTGPRRFGLRSRVTNWLRPPGRAGVVEAPSFSQRVDIATRTYWAQRYVGDVLLLAPTGGIADGGWGAVVDGELAIERTPGDHISMVREPLVQVLAARLDHALRQAQCRSAPLPIVLAQAAHAARS